mgnify:CR=1 FL=1
MKKFFYRYKTRRLLGLTLAVIGCLIVINVLPIEFLLLLIGLALIILGILVLK